MVEDGGEMLGDKHPLVRVTKRNGAFWIDRIACAEAQAYSKRLWMVVRDVSPNGHKLSENDVLKLGRFKFRIRQLVTSEDGQQTNLGLEDDSSILDCLADTNVEDMDSKTCRICLLEGPGDDDPLVTPCMCKGSIEHVHLNCLRHWVSTRLSLPDSQLGSYYYRSLACELCKATYPAYFVHESKRLPLIELPQTKPPYVVLESMGRNTRARNEGLHVVSLAEKPLSLGRGHSSDVCMSDVSISRCHATIRFEKGDFLLQDNDSKFGTLVAMKRAWQLEASRPISLQFGRTLLSLSLTTSSPPGAPVALAAQDTADPVHGCLHEIEHMHII